MKRQVLTVLMSFAAAMISGAVFVVALFHQFALVEVAASILTGLQVFFLSSAIGDLLDEKKESNRARNSAVALITVFLVGFYSFTRYFHCDELRSYDDRRASDF
jgi:fatty acid desaturase